jgi:hypothetical protein
MTAENVAVVTAVHSLGSRARRSSRCPRPARGPGQDPRRRCDRVAAHRQLVPAQLGSTLPGSVSLGVAPPDQSTSNEGPPGAEPPKASVGGPVRPVATSEPRRNDQEDVRSLPAEQRLHPEDCRSRPAGLPGVISRTGRALVSVRRAGDGAGTRNTGQSVEEPVRTVGAEGPGSGTEDGAGRSTDCSVRRLDGDHVGPLSVRFSNWLGVGDLHLAHSPEHCQEVCGTSTLPTPPVHAQAFSAIGRTAFPTTHR